MAEDETVGLDTTMDHGEPDGQAISGKSNGKSTYKSFKKKFRKMKIRFDEAMRESNELYILEQRGIKKARTLAIENDQILGVLLDQNDSEQMPLDKRIDISTTSSNLPPVPHLFDGSELDSFTDIATPEGRALYKELKDLKRKRDKLRVSLPSKSLAALLSNTPHISSTNPQTASAILADLTPLEGEAGPPGYLTPDQIDDYIESIDIKLGLEMPASHITAHPDTSLLQPDPSFGNLHSPYNWLRRNVPHIFLQDGETSEKSQNGKPGALRGAGKRASIPAPSKPDSLEIVEEDGQGYEFALGGPVATKGKRKRGGGDGDDESGGYHPKTGRVDDQLKVKKPRTYNRKPKATPASTPIAAAAVEAVQAGDESIVVTTPVTATKKRRPRTKIPPTDASGNPMG